MNWSERELRRAGDELVVMLTRALQRLDTAGYPNLDRLEETTAGTCWGEQTRQVA